MAIHEVELWVVVDEGGDYAVGVGEAEAQEAYGEQFGGEVGSVGVRRVKVTLLVPVPELIELVSDVPEGGVGGSLKVG